MKVVAYILVYIGEYGIFICHYGCFLTNINIRFVRVASTRSLSRVDWVHFECYADALGSAVFEVREALNQFWG